MKKAIGYARVSTSDQAENGVSLEAQESRIRAWCSLKDYDLLDVKVDRGLSGGRADNRPALQEALHAVGRGDVLVFYSLTRLARSTKDTLAIADNLDRRGADLVSLSEKIETTTASGKMIFRLLAVLSEFERDVISERTSLSMRYLKSQGHFLGGHAPFGWVRDGDRVVAIESEQEAANLAVQMRGEGLSLRKISEALATMGVLNRVGKPFAPTQVQRILREREAHIQAGSAVA